MNNKTIDLEVGDLNVNNVMSSIAVLLALNIDILKIKNNFKHFESPEGRGKKYLITRYKKKFKLIDESYNANPLSVKIAIKSLLRSKKKNLRNI